MYRQRPLNLEVTVKSINPGIVVRGVRTAEEVNHFGLRAEALKTMGDSLGQHQRIVPPSIKLYGNVL